MTTTLHPTTGACDPCYSGEHEACNHAHCRCHHRPIEAIAAAAAKAQATALGEPVDWLIVGDTRYLLVPHHREGMYGRDWLGSLCDAATGTSEEAPTHLWWVLADEVDGWQTVDPL